MTGAAPLALTLAMLATIALGWGGGWLLLKRRDRRRGALMLIAAAVLFGNVLVWTLPMPR